MACSKIYFFFLFIYFHVCFIHKSLQITHVLIKDIEGLKISHFINRKVKHGALFFSLHIEKVHSFHPFRRACLFSVLSQRGSPIVLSTCECSLTLFRVLINGVQVFPKSSKSRSDHRVATISTVSGASRTQPIIPDCSLFIHEGEIEL